MVTKKCLEILSSGGVIIYPTDTVYGIGCDATNLNSISKINENKPITSTSANFSGEKIPKYFKEINKDLLKLVDYSINFDKNQQNKASRIVSIDKMSNVKIIRS